MQSDKAHVDKIIKDPVAFGNEQADRHAEFKKLTANNSLNSNIITGTQIFGQLVVDLTPGLNLGDKIDKGNPWEISIAVLEDGSTVIGIGILAKGTKGLKTLRTAGTIMMGGTVAIKLGQALYEKEYGDPEKASLYFSEAQLRLLGFGVSEIAKIRQLAALQKEFRAAANKAAKHQCFAEPTLVATEAGLRPIKSISKGERVWSFDFKTGEWRLCTVEVRRDSIFEGPVVTLDFGTSEVIATAGHPFWVIKGDGLENRPNAGELAPDEDRGGSLLGRWVDSHELRAGDVVFRRDHELQEIQRVHISEVSLPVCNLKVPELHTFAVGVDQILVHNEDDCEKFARLYLQLAEADAKDTAAIQKIAKEIEELEAKIAAAPKTGGGYAEVRAANKGGDVHHMPADSASDIVREDSPAIWMETRDHAQTASFDNNKGARAYQQKQKQLIADGKMMEAIQMDIDDIRQKFGNKYDEAINQMIEYARFNGWIK